MSCPSLGSTWSWCLDIRRLTGTTPLGCTQLGLVLLRREPQVLLLKTYVIVGTLSRVGPELLRGRISGTSGFTLNKVPGLSLKETSPFCVSSEGLLSTMTVGFQ